MMAILASGDCISTQRPMMPPSLTNGNTWALNSVPLPADIHPIPIALLHGTDHTVETTVAKTFSECFDNDPC